MDFSAIEHYSDSRYSFAINEKELKVRLRTKKNDDIKAVYCLCGNSEHFYHHHEEQKMEIEFSDQYFDYYSTIIKVSGNDARLSYIFYIKDINDKGYYFSEDGVTETYDFNFAYYNRFSVYYINESDIIGNKTFEGDVFYQIFPERFRNGRGQKDYINRPWNSLDLKGPNNNRIQNVFLGGDFKGINEKVDYLKELGVDVIYLTPICESPSNHKYDVVDYFNFDPMFGTKEEFKALVDKLHANGMKIVLDLVFNHSSKHNPMFVDVLKNGKKSKYYDFYFMHDETFKDSGVNYETFGFTDQMPKLNSNNFDEQDYFVGVGKYFITEFGVDGYRLDVANEVSHTFWRYFKHELRRVKKDVILIGENWTNASSFLSASEFDSVMNYPFLVACKYFYVQKKFSALDFANRLNTLLVRYTDNSNKVMLNLLDSHDTERFYNFIKPNKELYLLAYLTLISYTGMPMIYYGDEIFMEGGTDPDNRRGMEWDSNEFGSKENQLFADITKLRKHEAFKTGDIKVTSKDDLVIIERFNSEESYQVIINNSGKDHKIDAKNVLLSNNFDSNTIHNLGFVVMKIK